MTVRWQTGEVRASAVFLDDEQGAPLLGASPVALARRKDTGALLSAPTVVELGDGFYRIEVGVPPADVLVRLALPGGRYVPLEVEVGGYVDRLDVPVSGRASQVSVDGLGAPAQFDDARLDRLDAAVSSRAAQSALDALVTQVGSPAQAATVASALDALSAAVGDPAQALALSSLASLVVALGDPAQADALDTALSRILAQVDVPTSTRATPADVISSSGLTFDGTLT